MLEAGRQVDGANLAGLEPSLHGDEALLGVDPDDDLSGEAAAGFAHEVRVAGGDCAEDDAVDADLQPGFDVFEAADAAEGALW